VPDIILPIGISFFTFQQISLLVDAHKGRVGQLRFWDHVLFIRAPD
jgi:D-alanyl-lipoteichoic acid acyltransferase DltB (MBOAT superfamily)